MPASFISEHKRGHAYLFAPGDITIVPEMNGRYESPNIEWLITDIMKHGQHTPVVIRNDGGKATLVSGFSRWRAISEINKRSLLPMPLAVRCNYVQCSESEAFILNISENRFRNPTTPVDDAHNIKRLLNIYQMTEEQIAGIYFPTAQTEREMKEARHFVAERIALITLSPEAEEAVRSGKVKPTAAKAIAKLSQEQQREVIKKEGTIELKDVVGPKAPKVPKAISTDAELLRRINAMFEDIAGLLPDKEFDYLEVKRDLLVSLFDYVEELKGKPKCAA